MTTAIDLGDNIGNDRVTFDSEKSTIIWKRLIGCENDPEPLENKDKINLSVTATQSKTEPKSILQLLKSAAIQIQKKIHHIPGYLLVPDNAAAYTYDGDKLEFTCAYKLADDNPLTEILAFNYDKMLRQAYALNNSVQELLHILDKINAADNTLDISYLVARVSDFVGLPEDIKEFTAESKAIAEKEITKDDTSRS